jgi:hypothetical protein
MLSAREITGVVLLVLPFAYSWYLMARLAAYRRERHPVFFTGFHVLRPDLYITDGLRHLHRLWLVLVLTIPWCAGVAFTCFR